jgi:aspartate kinase
MNLISAAAAAIDSPQDTRTVVWKFGGSSVADSTRLRAVAQRMVTAQRSGRRVVAVLSAMGKSTDKLSAMAYELTGQPSLREMDALLSVGEAISCALTSMAIQELGARAVSLTAAQAGIHTDGAHGNARLLDIQPDRVRAALDDGAIVLVTGFQGVAPDGDVTTMGRGGSDASAVAVAAALGVPECDIFTDVPGVYTADPRVVPDARRLSSLRHEEMLELAEAGAGVLQPRSVELAAAHGVDIHLRSSFDTQPGTWIRREPVGFGVAESGTSGDVAGVAHREVEPLFLASGLSPARVATTLATRGIAVGVLGVTGSSVRFSAPGVSDAEVTAALRGAGVEVAMREDLGTVSVVSMGIARKPEIAAQTLAGLADADIEPHLVTTTPGRVSVHLRSSRVAEAVRLLHRRFIPSAAADRAGSTRAKSAVRAEAAQVEPAAVRANEAVRGKPAERAKAMVGAKAAPSFTARRDVG